MKNLFIYVIIYIKALEFSQGNILFYFNLFYFYYFYYLACNLNTQFVEEEEERKNKNTHNQAMHF